MPLNINDFATLMYEVGVSNIDNLIATTRSNLVATTADGFVSSRS